MIFKYNPSDNSISRIDTIDKSSQFLFFNNNALILCNSFEITSYNLLSKQQDTLVYNSPKYIISTEYNSMSNTLIILSFSAKFKNQISVYDLNTKSDVSQHNLPEFKNHLTKALFLDTNRLVIFDSSNNIMLYNLKDKKFNQCYTNNSPSNLQSWYNKILGITKVNDDLIIAYTDYNFIPIYLNKPVPLKSSIDRDIISRNKAKSLEISQQIYHNDIISKVSKNSNQMNVGYKIEEDNDNFKILTKFISNIHMQYVNGNIIVIEVDWSKILSKMVNPIVKHKFGR